RILFAFIVTVLCSSACTNEHKSTNKINLTLSVTDDSTGIRLDNLPQLAVDQLTSDSLTSSQWQRIFSVFEEAESPDLTNLQSPMEGTYLINNSSIIFTPKHQFKEGKTYLAECYVKQLQLEPKD